MGTATLQRISEGEGLADLIQDLSDLAALIEAKASAFAGDTTFDAAAAVAQARMVGSDLSAGLSAQRSEMDQGEAKQLRDRACTYLDGLVSRVRDTGKYAFRRDEEALRHFQSAYVTRRNRSHRARKAAATPAA